MNASQPFCIFLRLLNSTTAMPMITTIPAIAAIANGRTFVSSPVLTVPADVAPVDLQQP